MMAVAPGIALGALAFALIRCPRPRLTRILGGLAALLPMIVFGGVLGFSVLGFCELLLRLAS